MRRLTICRDARSERPLYQRLQHHDFNGDGRTDRASLQIVICQIVTRCGRLERYLDPVVADL